MVPDHNKTFTIGVYVGKQLKATGTGHSKQEAEGAAAAEAVKEYLKICPNPNLKRSKRHKSIDFRSKVCYNESITSKEGLACYALL